MVAKIKNYKSREELKNFLVNSFSKEKEITSIFLFGKEVDKKTDQYSDIDMVVCSSDPAKTRIKYLKIIEKISPIIGLYLIENTEKDLAQMIMLKDFSPYQKIDFSITDNIDNKIKAGFGPFLCVYKNNNSLKTIDSKFTKIKSHNIRNQLYDFLFSVPRFTKCLFRKDYDMYRRWKSMTDILMILLYEKHFGWEKSNSMKKLSAQGSCRLYKHLSRKENKLLEKVFPPSGKFDIASSYVVCIEMLIGLCLEKADHLRVKIDNNFIKYIMEFLNSEIRHYKKLNGSNI